MTPVSLPLSTPIWIKICANTSLEDALHAAGLGADAVGFVFAPSKRQVTAEQVRPISAELPEGLERVGVFPALPAEQIAHAAETARLTAVQLHGGFDPALASRLHELMPGLAIIHTAHWVVGADSGSAVGQTLDRIAACEPGGRALVDAKVGGASGGTGVAFNWNEAARVLAQPRQTRIILAGGLRPENVAEAIRIVQPWGVDVASGVEQEPGKKDFAKLKAFIEAARSAHQSL